MKNLTILLLITLFSISCSSDDDIIGSGDLIEQQLNITNFNKIKIISSADVNLTYSAIQSVKLISDDNIINDISIEVRDNALIIKYKYDNINYNNTSTTLNITLPFIDNIKITGSSKIIVSDFNNLENLTIHNTGSSNVLITAIDTIDELHLNNSGSFKFKANGIVQDFFIKNSGSQRINCFDFIANNCTISNSGSGKIEVFCNDNLKIANSGSTDVYYKGFPNLIVNSTGSGSVESAN